jgi:hypothetical protein
MGMGSDSEEEPRESTPLEQEIDLDWKKYSYYDVEVDPDQDDRGVEMKLGKFSRYDLYFCGRKVHPF